MKPSTFAAVTLLPGTALGSALFPRQDSSASVPACVLECMAEAASGTNCATSDNTCLCSSQVFVANSASCFSEKCSQADADVGTQFGVQYCAAIGVTVTYDTESATSTAASSSSSASPSSSSSSTSSSVTSTPAQAVVSSTSTTTASSTVSSSTSAPNDAKRLALNSATALISLALAMVVLS